MHKNYLHFYYAHDQWHFLQKQIKIFVHGRRVREGVWKSCSLRWVGQLHNIKLKLRNFSRCEWGCGFKPTPSLLLNPFFTSLSLIVCHVYAWGLLNVHVQTNLLLEFTTGTCITFADQGLGWGWGLSISFLFMMCLRCNIHFFWLNTLSFDKNSGSAHPYHKIPAKIILFSCSFVPSFGHA